METERREIEIDIMQLFHELWKRVWIILAATGIVAAAALIVTMFFIKPVYTSSTSVYILNQQTGAGVTYNDVQLATQLTSDYEQLIKSRNVLESVIQELKLDVEPEALAGTISVGSETGTRILQISVTNRDPKTAQQIATRVCEVARIQIVEIMKIDAVNLVDAANLPTTPSGPNLQRNVLLGGLVGLVLACGIIILRFVLNDTIRSPEDVEKYLQLSVLGIIPDSEEGLKKKSGFTKSAPQQRGKVKYNRTRR